MNIPLTLAISPYDHVRGLRPSGIDLTVLELPIEEIFFRFTKFREWHASEMSFGKTVSLMAGIMIVLMGIFKLGQIINFIPAAVITGFTSGIAIISAVKRRVEAKA